ncbi:MAG: P1 family peptidase [Emticicia sp.]|nr:P1 family peptidase [Emticicia sp.]
MTKNLLFFIFFLSNFSVFAQKKRARDYGIEIGVLRIGKLNAITDVSGVKVGQVTFHQADGVHTGVTAILPHDKNIFQNKIPAAIHIGNGFGKLAGYSQVEELGNIETPIVLTNTLSVPAASAGIIDYTFQSPENKDVRSVNPIVGETNDGGLNDIRRRFITKEHVLEALKKAQTGVVEEGNIGAGTGTVCFGFKGGIGTSSRILPKSKGGYTVGVLVQSNLGGVLQVNGVPVGIGKKNINSAKLTKPTKMSGSCMIVVLTDAPWSAKNLKRLARRAMLGLGRTGGMAANGSGDYVIAASTAEDLRITHNSDSMFETFKVLRNVVRH